MIADTAARMKLAGANQDLLCDATLQIQLRSTDFFLVNSVVGITVPPCAR